MIAETLTELGTRCCMAQNYLPAIKDGDKRVLIVDGGPVPLLLARIPQANPWQSGGRWPWRPRPLTEKRLGKLPAASAQLKAKGLIFVGTDIIGDRLTEVNVTSPTCIREVKRNSRSRSPEC